MKRLILSLVTLFCAVAGATAQNVLAFPGADGYAKDITGGRGGKVYYVTRTDDCSDDDLVEGTLRWALRYGNDTARVILFNTNGTIYLTSKLRTVHDNVSILGQSAPGGGVCLAGWPLYIKNKNYIVRYMRFRGGDVPSTSLASLDVENAQQVMLDHCSITWSMEESLTLFDCNTTTVQWCIIGEGLYSSKNAKGSRAYATQWGGEKATMHHTLITNSHSRSPRFNGTREEISDPHAREFNYNETVGEHDQFSDNEFVNNVVFNWGGSGAIYGGEWWYDRMDSVGYNRTYMINNFYRPGPSTKARTANARYFAGASGATSGSGAKDAFGQWYLSGNKFEVNGTYSSKSGVWSSTELEKVNADNLYGFTSGNSSRAFNMEGETNWSARYNKFVMTSLPYALSGLSHDESAETAYSKVVEQAGAALPRFDEVDQRLLDEAAGKVEPKYIGSSLSSTTEYGIIDSPSDITLANHDTFTAYTDDGEAVEQTNYPFLGMADGDKYAVDSDADGLPDSYETSIGLDANNPEDAAQTASNGYTYLENYLNGIADGTINKADYETSDTQVEPGLAVRPETVTVTYTINGSTEGKAPEAQTLNYGDSITIAANSSIYREGCTMTGWTDGSRTYYIGNTYAITSDITLSPKFSTNVTNLEDRTEGITIQWSFKEGSNCPDDIATGSGVYVVQKAVEGKTIDVRLKYDNGMITLPTSEGASATVYYADDNTQKEEGTAESFSFELYDPQQLYRIDLTLPYVLAIPDGVEFHAPDLSSGKNYELVYTPDSATVNSIGKWINRNYYEGTSKGDKDTRNALIATNDSDDYDNLVVQSGVVVSSKLALTVYVKNTGLLKAYVSGSNSTGDYVQAIAVPTDGTEKSTAVTANVLQKNGTTPQTLCGTIELALDSTKQYQVTITSVSGYDMIVTALKLYTTGGVETVARYNVSAAAKPIVGGEVTVLPAMSSFAEGSQVTLKAVPEDGYYLDYWADAEGNKVAGSETYIYTANADASFTAYFASKSDREQKIYDEVVSNGVELAAALTHASNLATSDWRYRILLLDGTYDLGEAVKTLVGPYVSLIGEHKDSVFIINHPTTEGIDVTETLYTVGDDIYMQDITIINGLDDLTQSADNSAGRGLALRTYKSDRGVFKNVALKGNQDTYYSNNAGRRSYMEDCDISGTVDYIYGDGTVFFQNCNLYCNDRSTADVITAANTQADTKYGFVFQNCTIDCAESQVGKFNLGRPWNDSPSVTWLNTTFKQQGSTTGYARMTVGLVLRFHEWGSMDADGNVLDLSGRSLKTCRGASSSDTYLIDETAAAEYTVANVLGGTDNWDPVSIAAQIEAPSGLTIENGKASWNAVDGAYCYAICKNGKFLNATTDTSIQLPADENAAEYSIRCANTMGGLGEPCEAVTATVEAVAERVYYTPTVPEGSNWETLLGPDMLTTKAKTTDGMTAQKPAIDDTTYPWIEYLNTTSYLDDGTCEVQVASRPAKMDPETALTVDPKIAVFTGKNGSTNMPVLHAPDAWPAKTITFYVTGTARFRAFVTGSQGGSKSEGNHLTIHVESEDGSVVIDSISDRFVYGKSGNSDSMSVYLDPALRYAITVSVPVSDVALTGINLFTAESLQKEYEEQANGIAIIRQNEEGDDKAYNLQGQRIDNAAANGDGRFKGVMIRKGRKVIVK